jgi:hypothetical protein
VPPVPPPAAVALPGGAQPPAQVTPAPVGVTLGSGTRGAGASAEAVPAREVARQDRRSQVAANAQPAHQRASSASQW